MTSNSTDERPRVLECRDVERRFGGLVAVTGVNMHIHQGEIFGLVGPNGSGKTTMTNAITGFFPPQKGQILLNGERAPAGFSIDSLSPDVIERIRDELRAGAKSAARAIELGGSTLRDFKDAHGMAGAFQDEALVYGREGQPCLADGCTGVIQRDQGAKCCVSIRSSAHCSTSAKDWPPCKARCQCSRWFASCAKAWLWLERAYKTPHSSSTSRTAATYRPAAVCSDKSTSPKA